MVNALAKVDEELVSDLTNVIEELGGSITIIDMRNKIFRLDVDPRFQTYASKMVNDIFSAYRVKRARLLEDNPFLGVEEIVEDLG